MKKILTLILVLTLVFVSACSKGNKNSGTDETTPIQETTSGFDVPKNYATVVLVTINPEFRLYLDVAGEVLAVEPVNDDAKSVIDNVDTKNGNISTVIEDIVEASNKGGFVDDDATFNFEIKEIKDEKVNAEDVFTKARESAENSFKALDVEVKITTTIAEDAKGDVDENESQTVPDEVHEHDYSDATCLLPATCSCGETEGEALGHDFVKGVCSRCNEVDPDFSYPSVSGKKGRWTAKFVDGDTLYSISFRISNSEEKWFGVGLGDLADNMMEGLTGEDLEMFLSYCTLFGDKYYYMGRGDGSGITSVSEDGMTVTVKGELGSEIILTRTDENEMVVKTSPDTFECLDKIPEGLVLTFVAE
ncbi:MAG: hypothetical protein E7265_05510 [Lachnospiraceae bacterium]|nr:hypothetical protein [Lachnospiraceae bacterium]